MLLGNREPQIVQVNRDYCCLRCCLLCFGYVFFFVFKVSVCKRPAWLEIVAAISAKSITKAHCRSVIRSFWLAGVFLPPQICKIFLYSEFPEFPVTLKRLCHSLLGMDPEQKLPTEETQEDGLNQQVRLVTLTGQLLAHIFSQLFRSVI